jgi:hypothetical protein
MKAIGAVFLSLILTGCTNYSEEECGCTYNDSLPVPERILRKGSGFTPTRYSFSLDLSTGNAEYERVDGLASDGACEGTLNVGDDLAAWKKAAQLVACTRVLSNPRSDGWIDSMVLYFPASEPFPEHLTRQEAGDWVTIELQEKFVNSVEGRQQFECSGQFEIDLLIKGKAPCLGLD